MVTVIATTTVGILSFLPGIGLLFYYFLRKQVGKMPVVGILLLMIVVTVQLYWFSVFVLTRFFYIAQVHDLRMFPSLQPGEFVLVQKRNAFVVRSSVQRGDVVDVADPEDTSEHLLVRVIGLPGEHIAMTDGIVSIEGDPLIEYRYIVQKIHPDSVLANWGDRLVPFDGYYVMNDYRTLPSDSRQFGSVSYQNIVGKVLMCYWNCDR